MIQHPTLHILALLVILIITYKKNDVIFKIVALSIPVISAVSIYFLPQCNFIHLYNLTLIYDGGTYNKLIGIAFSIILLSANLYAIGQNKKLDLILGNAYGGFSLLCLFARDFISVFVALELMMIFSSMIIFIGGERSSIRSAKKYFLTHLLSSNMIIIGVVYLITKGQGVELVSVTPLVEDPEYSSFILYIMLAGLLINIAIFPFSGWMVNNYPTASGSGFLYLISFTTKVSILLLVKLFAGYEPLIYIAITMIIYASIKAIFEDNLMSLLCLLSIIVMGVMLAAIGKGGTDMIEVVIYYLFIHVIYKMLLSVSVVSIVDSTGIKNCSELRKVNSNIVLSALLIGIIIMMNIPMTSSFYMKSYISNAFLGNAVYFVTLFSSFMIAFSLPWKHYLVSKKYIEINLNIYCKLSIVLMSLVTIVIGLFGKKIFEMISDVTFNISNIDMLKQIIVILIALGISTHYSISRIHTKPVNLIEKVGSLLFYFYTRSLSIKVKEKKHSLFSNLDDKITKKLSSAHNQQTAIFIVFTIFIIILMILEI